MIKYVWKGTSQDSNAIQIARQNMLTLLFAVDHPSLMKIDAVIHSDLPETSSSNFTVFLRDPPDLAIDVMRKRHPHGRPVTWIDIACSVAKALDYLHTLGIPHGGINIESIRMNASGVVKLFDPGLIRTERDLESLRKSNPSRQTASAQDILRVTSRRPRARFLKDKWDFGITLLRLLLLDDGRLSLSEMLVTKSRRVDGWPPLIQDAAVNILSPFISCHEDNLDSDYRLPVNPTKFLSSVSGFRELLILARFHSSTSTKTSVHSLAEELHPLMFTLMTPTVVEIVVHKVSGPTLDHCEFYALLKLDSGETTWAVTKRSIGGYSASDTITFCRNPDLLRDVEDGVVMACTYRSLTLQKLARALPLLNRSALGNELLPINDPISHHLDSWWYLIALLSVLRPYRAEWTIPPTPTMAARAVASLNKPVGRLLVEAASGFARAWSNQPGFLPCCYFLFDWQASSQRLANERPWMSTELSVQKNSVLSVRQILDDPQKSSLAKKVEFEGHAVELLQDVSHQTASTKPHSITEFVSLQALDHPQNDLGDDRPRAIRLLQDLVSQSERLPQRVKILPVRNRVFRDAGGEAVI
ncbi:hypothetical protein DL93DRAFT_1184685 [Clavulina sp. PMI_390]|nr:hypothetical protein DL93DRAFT_1184685 [Clavulina sp. PMI_390]